MSLSNHPVKRTRGSYWSFRDLWPFNRKVVSEVIAWENTTRHIFLMRDAPPQGSQTKHGYPPVTTHFLTTKPPTGQALGYICYDRDAYWLKELYDKCKRPDYFMTGLLDSEYQKMVTPRFRFHGIWINGYRATLVHWTGRKYTKKVYDARGYFWMDLEYLYVSDTGLDIGVA